MHGLLYFPSLHPALSLGLVPGVRFLDPGLADSGAGPWLRPEGLPLVGDELAGMLRGFDQLRREVKNPKDLALLAGASGGHFFADTSFAVREAFADQEHPERVAARRAKSAQLALCLAYMVEESLLGLAGTGELDARFATAMAESLGLGDDDSDEALATALAGVGDMLPAAALADEFRPPWRQVLSPFWAVAPEGAGLLVVDPDMAATLLDAGLPFAEPAAPELAGWFPDGRPETRFLAACATGWRVLGKTRPDPDAPWLDAPRPIVIPKP
uniref:Uncharacterized protein n=1 Tax=Desulfovibrio sp. U5L TaxID=596152 RepID=I2Q161_9BACT